MVGTQTSTGPRGADCPRINPPTRGATHRFTQQPTFSCKVSPVGPPANGEPTASNRENPGLGWDGPNQVASQPANTTVLLPTGPFKSPSAPLQVNTTLRSITAANGVQQLAGVTSPSTVLFSWASEASGARPARGFGGSRLRAFSARARVQDPTRVVPLADRRDATARARPALYPLADLRSAGSPSSRARRASAFFRPGAAATV